MNVILSYKFGLLFNGLKPYFVSTLTESIEEPIDELEDIKTLYKSQEIKIIKVGDDTVEIYLYSDAKKDLVYYATIIESVLKSEKFEGNKIHFRFYIDDKLIDEFAVNATLLAVFADALLHNATKIDATDNNVVKTMQKIKLDPNKEPYVRMVLLKGELFSLDKNTALSFSLKQAIKQNDKSLIDKIKEFMTAPINTVTRVYKALISYVFHRFHRESFDIIDYYAMLESFAADHINDTNREQDRNGKHDDRRDNRRQDRDERDSRDRDHNRDRNRDREERRKHKNRERINRPQNIEILNTDKLLIVYAAVVIIYALIHISFGIVATVIEKMIILGLMTFGIYIAIEKFNQPAAKRMLDQKITPEMAYYLAK